MFFWKWNILWEQFSWVHLQIWGRFLFDLEFYGNFLCVLKVDKLTKKQIENLCFPLTKWRIKRTINHQIYLHRAWNVCWVMLRPAAMHHANIWFCPPQKLNLQFHETLIVWKFIDWYCTDSNNPKNLNFPDFLWQKHTKISNVQFKIPAGTIKCILFYWYTIER